MNQIRPIRGAESSGQAMINYRHGAYGCENSTLEIERCVGWKDGSARFVAHCNDCRDVLATGAVDANLRAFLEKDGWEVLPDTIACELCQLAPEVLASALPRETRLSIGCRS